MVTVVVIEFGVMRCQPLRRALCPKHFRSSYVNRVYRGKHLV
ncbi:acetyltransferase [Vibrio mimicus]|nr:acetyltransferase [Vibrio mimicus]MBY7676588.1 acetyltransferase [Vibrio mimicus]MBY7728429.1 acetyltransferase [Vibrio mimicus]TXY30251.1 acetyltransferase [Vibrio mimicus]